MALKDIPAKLDPVQLAFFQKLIANSELAKQIAIAMTNGIATDAVIDTAVVVAASLSIALMAGHQMSGRYGLDRADFERVLRAALDVMLIIDADFAAEGAKQTMSEVDALFAKKEVPRG